VLSLDDPRWETLYPVAGDTAEMLDTLAALARVTADERFARTLTYLMAMVWHDNDSCPAALAIAPHLAAVAGAGSVDRRARCIHCIALFEVARRRATDGGFGPVVPPDVEAEYAAVIKQLPELVAGCLAEPWTFEVAVKLAGALLVTKGHSVEGHQVMQLRPVAESGPLAPDPADGGIPW
jgi:hypothetical protein